MSDAPAFSIVIPAYNYAHFLRRAVTSACTQEGIDVEVLVVDDGSTDDTPAVMETLGAEFGERLAYHRQANQGPAAARATGLALARHDWLVFLDADDELLPDALRVFADLITAHPQSRVAIAGHLARHGDRERRVTPGPVSDRRRANFQAYLDKRLSLSNGACALHRSVFDSAPLASPLPHTEDMPVFAHLMARYDACKSDQPVLRVYHHGGSRRNDVAAALALGMALEGAIFDDNGLPDWAGELRRGYRARRALSLLKLAARGGRPDQVRFFFHRALGADWRRALQPRYLRRYLASFVRRRKPS